MANEHAEHFDLVVVGSGPAGEKGASVAAYHGMRVAVVEQAHDLGGTVVSTGGVPTKALRETAMRLRGGQTGDGLTVELDRDAVFARLRARAGAASAQMAEAVRTHLAHAGVEVVHGSARLTDGAGEVAVAAAAGQPERLLTGEVVLLATGSRPLRPAMFPFDGRTVVDSDEILRLDRPFASLVVVGAGAVGAEYASIFAAIGTSVTLVDAGPRLLPLFDAEIAATLASAMQSTGVELRLGQPVERVDHRDGRVAVTLAGGEVQLADRVLVAAGRRASTAGLGLEAAGVEVKDGHVVVDRAYRTTVPRVYAAGDIVGPPALASASMEQARVAVNSAFGFPLHQEVDELQPLGVYAIPEVAAVGITEEAAAAAGIDYEVGRAWFARNTKAIVSGDTDGLLKLVFERSGSRLLGVHIAGAEAAELVHQGQAVLRHGGGIDEFIHATYNVPTRSDAYKYAAYDGLKRAEARAAFGDVASG